MKYCIRLQEVNPDFGCRYGRCPLMNNGRNVKDYLAIRERVMELLKKKGEFKNIMPNGECPFFNNRLDQTACPCYEK